jgi:hypothetical protein
MALADPFDNTAPVAITPTLAAAFSDVAPVAGEPGLVALFGNTAPDAITPDLAGAFTNELPVPKPLFDAPELVTEDGGTSLADETGAPLTIEAERY